MKKHPDIIGVFFHALRDSKLAAGIIGWHPAQSQL